MRKSPRSPVRLQLLAGLTALAALVLPGCGGGKGEVSGKVRLNGAPVSRGRVNFISEKSSAASVYSLIGEDGTYKVRGCPTGPVKITVQTGARGAQAAEAAVPARYGHPEKSGLAYTVKRGRQQHDIDLSDGEPAP